MPEGEGCEIAFNKIYFKGTYKNGFKKGYGILQKPGEFYLVGIFDHNSFGETFQGYGCLKGKKGERYEDFFENGKLDNLYLILKKDSLNFESKMM